MRYASRQKKLLKILKSRSLDALIIKKKQNIFYLTGAKGDDAILFVSPKKKLLITDSRYKEEYAKSLKKCLLKVVKYSEAASSIKDICKKTNSRRIGFESKSFSYSEYTALKKELKNKRLVPARDIVESLRIVKDDQEVKCIKKACKIGCKIMNHAIKILKPFDSEERVKNNIDAYIAKNGFKKADFEIIVASGKRACMPHASASTKIIRRGDMVVIDLGAMNCGYNSDLTRTVFLGRIEQKYRRIYSIVLAAQKKAIESIRPGIKAKYIDHISRQYILDRGLGKYFNHNLGHGIGLEVHEKPAISRNSNVVLEKNMIFTVEPGIYIPGYGGVRIEDDVLVTKTGCEILTSSTKK